jgi:hypothetical protein
VFCRFIGFSYFAYFAALLLKLNEKQQISKEICRAEHEYMNMQQQQPPHLTL